MARPDKAFKRSARAVQQLAKRTSDRVETAQTSIDAGNYTTNQFAMDIAAQAFDAWGSWLELFRAGRDSRPDAFIDILVTGNPGGTAAGNATVALDDTMQNIGLLHPTQLANPGGTIAATSVVLTNLGSLPQVDDLGIRVTVQNNQTPGLYQGYVTDGSTVQVNVIVSVHL